MRSRAHAPYHAIGLPLAPKTRQAIEPLIARLGEVEAARLLGVARITLVRALAGLTLYPGTRHLLEANVQKVTAEDPRAV